MPQFAKEGYRVLALDMVGFGSTESPDPQNYEYSNDNRVKHVIAFIEALDLQQVHLVGNSMGGAASLGVAIQRPELVQKNSIAWISGASQTEGRRTKQSAANSSRL